MKSIDWNQMSELGLIRRINTNVLNPIRLAICRNPDTGTSDLVLVAEDGVWEYSSDISTKPLISNEEIKSKLNEMAVDFPPKNK